MNLVFITVDAPMYLPEFLDAAWLRLAAAGHQLTGVAVFSACAKGKVLREAWTRLLYYGPVDFARMSGLILANQARGRTVEAVRQRHNLPLLVTKNVNNPEFLQKLRHLETDLVISVASPQIFRPALLATPRCGCLNVHMAKLPRYRGREPLFWALLAGEPEVAATVHEIDAKLDNGPIVVQKPVIVEREDSLHSLFQKACAAGADALSEAVEKIVKGDPARLPNDATLATTFSFPDQEAARLFRARGRRFF